MYYIDQKFFALKDRVEITDQNNKLVYSVQGKLYAFEINKKLKFIDAQNKEIFAIHNKFFKILPEYKIIENGQLKYIVKKGISLFGRKAKIKDHEESKILKIKSSLLGYKFNILTLDNQICVEVDKSISLKDKYQVNIKDNKGFSDEALLAFVIAYDAIFHSNKTRK